jgi:RNA polymerase sigma factor (sigma-70 family)
MTTEEYNKSVDLYADRLYRFVRKTMGDKPQAKDVIQDVFEKLWLDREQVDINNMKAFRAFLFTSAYFFMMKELKRSNFLNAIPEGYFEKPADQKHSFDVKDVLDEALEHLPPAERVCILLKDLEGYDYDEIGELMSISSVDVRRSVFRGRLTLKKYLVSIENII